MKSIFLMLCLMMMLRVSLATQNLTIPQDGHNQNWVFTQVKLNQTYKLEIPELNSLEERFYVRWVGGGVGRRRGAAAWVGGCVGWRRRGLAAAWTVDVRCQCAHRSRMKPPNAL